MDLDVVESIIQRYAPFGIGGVGPGAADADVVEDLDEPVESGVQLGLARDLRGDGLGVVDQVFKFFGETGLLPGEQLVVDEAPTPGRLRSSLGVTE